jgi:hypothetical protein
MSATPGGSAVAQSSDPQAFRVCYGFLQKRRPPGYRD